MAQKKAHESSQTGSRCKPSALDGPGAAGRPDRPPPPGLHIVATPIGNLRDITLRALDILREVDAIICEDTRVTKKLLTSYGISKALIAYHDHNAARERPKLVERLARGETLALVSDAGTPLISDPGYKLVREAAEHGIGVFACPGPSAALAGLVVSGLPSDRFLFAGFLPVKAGARRTALTDLAPVETTLVFFESTRRLGAVLADMASVLGPRPAAVARELTKLHEEVRRGTLADLAAHYDAAGAPRGEAVIVVGPPDGDAAALGEETLDALIGEALADLSVRDAADKVAAETGLKRRDVYRRALDLRALARSGEQ